MFRFSGLVFLGIAVVSLATAETAERQDLEAAFIRHFGIYTKWPSTTFVNLSSPVTACFVGNDPRGVGRALREAASHPAFKIGQRNLNVRTLGRASLADTERLGSQIKNCQILFVSNVRIKDWVKLYEIVADTNVLTIGDTRGFAENGGMIELYLVNSGREYRFKVNLENVRRANLDLDSALLTLSVVKVIGS